MASPEMHRRVAQLRHDVDDVYELLDTTNQTVATIAATQRRHGTRLEEIQQTLDLTVGRLDRLEHAQQRLADAQERFTGAAERLAETQRTQADALERLAETQRTQYEELTGKLDSILAVLRSGRPGE